MCRIKLKRLLLKNARVFEQFLYQIYYTLLEDKYGQDYCANFLIHASGVKKEGYAYVFTGPSGSGKTTIATLSSPYAVLNDEILILGQDNGSFRALSTPFNGGFPLKSNTAAPLRAIFCLRQSKSNYVKKLSKAEFIKIFMREVVLPLPLLSVDRPRALTQVINFCAQVSRQVPFYELNFIPDTSFWHCIEPLSR